MMVLPPSGTLDEAYTARWSGLGEIWVGSPVSTDVVEYLERSKVPKPGRVTEVGNVDGSDRKTPPAIIPKEMTKYSSLILVLPGSVQIPLLEPKPSELGNEVTVPTHQIASGLPLMEPVWKLPNPEPVTTTGPAVSLMVTVGIVFPPA